MERRLAAVLIADVVGYTRMSEVDEEGTRVRFHADLHELFEPKIATHHGRLVKTMGDGVLVEFHGVVDAVHCAVELQQEKAERNAALPPEQRMVFRIGVNLGDIIVEGEDIHGDGVNIADRMQVLAEPGGIAISGTTYDQVRSKLAVGYLALDERRVKNIAEPIRVYRVVLDPAVERSTIGATRTPRAWAVPVAAMGIAVFLLAGLAWWQPWQAENDASVAAVDTRRSLVVLPFDNLSDSKEQGYLADGITEDLTTELARIPGLFVISRNAAFTFKNKSSLPEGSVRRAGAEMRINAKLIDSTTNGNVWAERFDGEWSEVFELQDRMVGEIATALKLRLVTSHQVGPSAGGTSNLAAYEAYLRGRELELRERPEDWVEAVKYYEQALALDRAFGNAAAALAWIYREAHWTEARSKVFGLSQDEARSKADAYFTQAAKNPSPGYYTLLAGKLKMMQKSDEAIAAAERAIALDASDPSSYESLSSAMIFNGRAENGLGYLDAAARVDPAWSRERYYLAGLAYFSMDRFEEAVVAFEKIAPESKETSYWDFWANYNGLVLLISAYGHLGRHAYAAAARERLKPYLAQAQEPEYTGLMAAVEFPFKNYVDLERVLVGLRKAGVPDLPEGFSPKPEDRLDGDAIRALLFGHEIQGRNIETGEAYRRVTAPDGTTVITVGEWSDQGSSKIEGDMLCSIYPTRWRFCGVIVRNRDGTFAQMNEYRLILQWDRFEFSMVK
ncbi:adenylate/guanylate cyclase domain-containing protein [Rhizobium gallicum]|nr:adenylate/guanylate cyclase domain-containing protein [Rhizobium gallicum]